MSNTVYKVECERGEVTYTDDTEAAEAWSRMGMKVTARTGKQ